MSRAIDDAPVTRPVESVIGEISERDVDHRPVLPHTFRFEGLTRFSASCLFQHRRREPGARAGRHDERTVPPDDLGRRVAIQAFRTRVPGEDRVIQRRAVDGIIGRVDNGCQASARLVRLHARRDVLGDTHAAHRFAVLAEEHAAGATQPPNRAVGPDRSVQDREIGASLHGLPDRLEHGRPIVGMNALDERLEGPAKRAGLQAVLRFEGFGPLDPPVVKSMSQIPTLAASSANRMRSSAVRRASTA